MKYDVNQLQNTGVIDTEPQLGDFVAEGDSGIVYEAVEEDFSPYVLPDNGDYQIGVYFDTLACTDYGCGHSLETQLNRFLKKGILNDEEKKKLIETGFITEKSCNRLSKRYNSILAGTNGGQKPGPGGNYLYKPWESARHDGMVPDSVCPYPRLQRNPVFTVEHYYDPGVISDQARAVADIWKTIFEVKYEIVPTDISTLAKHLKQAPLCINAGVCKPWSSGTVPVCELTGGHCTVVYGLEPSVLIKDEDSYQPSLKTLAWGYNISYAIKGVLYLKRLLDKLPVPVAPKRVWTKMEYGQKSPDIKNLQDYLKAKGFFPTTVHSTGFYGLITAKAVLKFQQYHQVAPTLQLLEWGGKYVGPLTLKVLNYEK